MAVAELAVASSVTVYDALYIALALHREIPLLTLDEKQRRAARQHSVQVLPWKLTGRAYNNTQ